MYNRPLRKNRNILKDCLMDRVEDSKYGKIYLGNSEIFHPGIFWPLGLREPIYMLGPYKPYGYTK